MKRTLMATALFAAGCGTAALEVGSSADQADDIGSTTYELAVKKAFGGSARIQHRVDEKEKVLLAVAFEDATPESDVIPPVAIAAFDKARQELDVVAEAPLYREARSVATGIALVTVDHKLELGGKTLAENVKGDVAAAPDGRILVALRGAEAGNSSVAITDGSGAVTVLADGVGVDDRPTVSPDGKIVVFVSGRTGIASLWTTDLSGAAPVQLTNAGIEPSGDGPPAGFVPPPVSADEIRWVNAETLRFDAGGGEEWEVNVVTGAARRIGGAQ